MRANYYGLLGVPTTWCDGVIKREGAYSYSTYRADFDTRKNVSSLLEIELTGSYNAGTGQGNIDAHVTNTSGSTVSGTIQFILTETDIAYSWQTEDSVFHVVRDIIPDGYGEAVTINPGSPIVKSRNFTVNTSWNDEKCDIIVFVQGASKEIYQGAKIHIMDIAVEESPGSEIRNPKLEISPNPFSTKAVIEFRSSGVSELKDSHLQIYDLAGRLVKTFLISDYQLPITRVVWDGLDEFGMKLASGIYLCVLKSEDYRVVNKMILAR